MEDLRVLVGLGPTRSVLSYFSNLGLILSKKRTTLRRRGKSSGEKIDERRCKGDNILDDSVLTANINTVTYLSVNQNSIADLTGIEDFTNLTEFICSNNLLTSLDLSSNIACTTLVCNKEIWI